MTQHNYLTYLSYFLLTAALIISVILIAMQNKEQFSSCGCDFEHCSKNIHHLRNSSLPTTENSPYKQCGCNFGHCGHNIHNLRNPKLPQF